ncbi:MAG: type II CAAX endopeptidase family protein [Anaerolineales bacterium]
MQDPSMEPTFVQENAQDDSATAHWSVSDTWLGVGLLVMLIAVTFLIAAFSPSITDTPLFMIGFELLLLAPIAIIFVWRKVSWRELGFRKFDWSVIGLGCGALIFAYILIFVHNLIMTALGIITQGDVIFDVFDNLDSPILFFFVGMVMAPLMEETFYRGFLFKGFRQKYGWKAALILSAFIFSLSHLQLAALFPTFLLGCILAYMYHRTNSLFPGMILHFMINAWGLCAAFALYKSRGI